MINIPIEQATAQARGATFTALGIAHRYGWTADSELIQRGLAIIAGVEEFARTPVPPIAELPTDPAAMAEALLKRGRVVTDRACIEAVLPEALAEGIGLLFTGVKYELPGWLDLLSADFAETARTFVEARQVAPWKLSGFEGQSVIDQFVAVARNAGKLDSLVATRVELGSAFGEQSMVANWLWTYCKPFGEDADAARIEQAGRLVWEHRQRSFIDLSAEERWSRIAAVFDLELAGWNAVSSRNDRWQIDKNRAEAVTLTGLGQSIRDDEARARALNARAAAGR
jgi:hypothetical protein